jgi:4-amino-4-deoxy-L-arabinose transferase-like glycosyltransferase
VESYPTPINTVNCTNAAQERAFQRERRHVKWNFRPDCLARSAPVRRATFVCGGPPRTARRRRTAHLHGVIVTRVRGRLAPWVAILVAVNVAVLAAYLWSRGGQTTLVRVEARGTSFTTYIDGELRASGQFDAPDAGGVTLAVDTGERQNIPSLPHPRGVASVRVTDLDSGDVLFEDDFEGGLDERWQVVTGTVEAADGVAKPHRVAALRIDAAWRDYAVDVRLRNVLTGNVTVRSTPGGAGVLYSVRPFSEHDDSLSLLAGQGVIVQTVPGSRAPFRESELIRSMTAMVLRPYPYIVGAIVLAVVAMIIVQLAPRARAMEERELRLPPAAVWIPVAALAAAAFGVASYFMYGLGSHQPHVPDELSYIFQAKLFASFDVSASPPPVDGAFDSFSPPLIPVADGRWASAYPFGHPLLLTAGVWAGAIWIVPPLLGALSVVGLFALGRKLYGVRTGLLAAVLLASSPFFLMISGSFMSHTSAMFYLLCSMLCLAYGERRPALMWCLAGVFFGLLFNTRPLTALGLMTPFGLAMLATAAVSDDRRMAALRLGSFAVGGLMMVGAYLAYNYGTGGDALQNGYQRPFPVAATLDCAYQSCGSLDEGVGFSGRHSVSAGIQNQQVQIALLLLVANGWPVAVGLSFALLPFLLGTRRWTDWFLLVCILSVVAAWAFFEGTGIMYGPRYWYEALPLLMLLTARGAERAAEFLNQVVVWLRTRWPRLEVRRTWAPYAAAYAIVLALCGYSVYAWLLGQDVSWKADFVPEKASALRGFNGINGGLTELVDDAHLKNALVVVEQCPNWQCYGTVFWQNEPSLDGDVVFARDTNASALFAAFPDRLVYAAGANPPYLAPYGTAPGTPLEDARPAAQTTPIGRSTPEPISATAQARDAQRRADLGTIAGGLEQFRARHGTYPNTNGTTQRLCLFLGADAGCLLGEVLDFIPQDPVRERSYFYSSSGTEYTLYAQMDLGPDRAQCPDPLPFEVRLYEQSLYCLSGP